MGYINGDGWVDSPFRLEERWITTITNYGILVMDFDYWNIGLPTFFDTEIFTT